MNVLAGNRARIPFIFDFIRFRRHLAAALRHNFLHILFQQLVGILLVFLRLYPRLLFRCLFPLRQYFLNIRRKYLRLVFDLRLFRCCGLPLRRPRMLTGHDVLHILLQL